MLICVVYAHKGPTMEIINYSILFYPIRNVIFTSAPLGVVLKMYKDTKWHSVISNLKQVFGRYTDIIF